MWFFDDPCPIPTYPNIFHCHPLRHHHLLLRSHQICPWLLEIVKFLQKTSMYIYIYTYIHVYTKSLSTTKKLYISTCIVQSCLCFYHNTIARLKHRHEQRGANQTRSNWLAANAWITPGNTNPRHSEGSACKKPNLRKNESGLRINSWAVQRTFQYSTGKGKF